MRRKNRGNWSYNIFRKEILMSCYFCKYFTLKDKKTGAYGICKLKKNPVCSSGNCDKFKENVK